MEFIQLGRPVVFVLAVCAAVCVTAGSWLRLRRGSVRGRADGFLIRFGYLLFFLSIIAFIALGFVNG